MYIGKLILKYDSVVGYNTPYFDPINNSIILNLI